MEQEKNAARRTASRSDSAKFKEKISMLYDEIFKGKEPWKQNAGFWDEFFLLWPNAKHLEEMIADFDGNSLARMKPLLNFLFSQCVICIRDDQGIRAVNAMETLAALIRAVAAKAAPGFGFDLLDFLIGFDRAEGIFKLLLDQLNAFLQQEDRPNVLKTQSLRLLLTLSTCLDTLAQNTLMEFLLINSVFESVVSLISNPQLRFTHGHDALLLLTLLINYRKYENVNPYIVKLSILDDELALNGYSLIIAHTLAAYNRSIQKRIESAEPSGMFSSMTKLVGNMFVANDESHVNAVKTDEGMLMALYEAVHLNRNFITSLTHISTKTATSDQAEVTATPAGTDNGGDASSQNENGWTDPFADAHTPTNLLVAFLTYCSVIMQDLKNDRNQNAAKLCMITLSCVAEDQYANTLMHDVNMAFRVPLYRAPMRHRKAGFERAQACRPLACAVLDLCREFIMSHMMRSLPFDLYMRSLGVIHRILCFEKKCRVRLQYPWRDLWNCLAALLKFVVHNEGNFKGPCDIFQLCQQVINIFNLFITFGDTFLPNPTSYDELYYELVRNGATFEDLYTMGLRLTAADGEHKPAAVKLCNNMVNIRGIIGHFRPKIEETAAYSLSEQEILAIVRHNYDSLTLKLHENLDAYDRYNEKPQETAFFNQMVKFIVLETRHHIRLTQLDHKTILKELRTIVSQ